MEKKIAARIKKEKARLWEICKDIPEDKKGLAEGLIDRAAWSRIQCEDLEIDLLNNGWTSKFQQSKDLEPYDRARPQGQTYQTLHANYLKTIKQLENMIPSKPVSQTDDGFDSFVLARDD